MSRQITLLVNPAAGRGRGGRAGRVTSDLLRSAGLSVRELVGRDVRECQDMAHEAVAAGTGALAVVGGDGMVHLGLQAVAETPVAFGVIPAGSGNDFARALGVPMGDAAAAARVIERGAVRTIDLGRSNGQWFAGVVAAGFDARVNERANRMAWPRGRSRYNLAMLVELGVLRPIPYVLELDGQRWETDAMLVTVGNASTYGGGMKVLPEARLDDGMLDVLVLQPLSKARFLSIFPKVYSGRHVDLPYVEVRRAREMKIDAPGIVAYVDGERLGPLPRAFEAVADAVRVLVPSAG